MAMAAYEYPDDKLAYAADQVDVPKGYRVEIIEGEIIVSPSPQGPHIKITTRLERALQDASPSEMDAVQFVTLDLVETGQRYIPDVVVLPSRLLDEPISLFPSDAALLVAEVTSPSNATTDRVRKLRGYARSHIPMYVLVDRQEKSTTLFTAPEDGIYRGDVRVPFGEKLILPEPFSGEIDTSEFV